jgi:N utilization substance protein A
MLSIDGFDEDLVETLRARARDVLLTAALAGDESREPQDDLLTMEGMTPGLAYQLADRGVCTMEDLAELSVDELTEIEGVDEAAAAALIMKAREPWFADDADESAEESSEQE